VHTSYPDIERDGFTFSDGCGFIRPDVAHEIAAKFKFTKVSGFQIRLGGAKGVLAVCNDLSKFKDGDKEYKILLRNSQVKFQSDNLTLDIVRCATFSQGFLNR
jgi:RNA-dependent RNA polymerase